MGRKLWNLLLFLAVIAACGGLTFFMGKDASGLMIYNFVFLGIMVVIYFISMVVGMWKMCDLSRELRNSGSELEQYFQQEGPKSERVSTKLDNLFHHPFLDHKMKNFLLGMRKSKEGIVDLEEYLNEDELDNFVHRRMLEMVPDILTSLGILGTFVGLVLGLRSFEPSSYETMTNSISVLVEGIKVAFLTSIYGVSLSIVYTFGMKSEYSGMIEALQDFLAKFHAFVMPTAESKSRNLMIATQKQQTEAMGEMVTKFTEQMITSFQAMITPTFDRMNYTLENLSNSVLYHQEEAMKEIVHAFLEGMNQNLNLELTNFRASLEQMTEAQKETTDFTRDLYQTFAEELRGINVQAVRNASDMTRELGSVSEDFLRTAKELQEQNQEIQKSLQGDYQHVVEYLKDAEQSAAKFWVACNQSMQKYVETAAQGNTQFQAVGEKCDKTIAASQKAISLYNTKMKELAQYQKLSYQVMLEVAKLLNGMAVIGDEKNLYLVGGDAAGRLTESANQEALQSMRRILEEQSRAQQEFMEELNTNIEVLAQASQKKRFKLF